MCVLGSQKNEASVIFAPTTKASRNRTTFHKAFFFLFKDAGVLLFAVFSQLQSR